MKREGNADGKGQLRMEIETEGIKKKKVENKREGEAEEKSERE